MLVLDHTRVARTKPNREPVRRILPHLEEEQHLKDYQAAILIARKAQTWKFKGTLLHNEEPCRAQTLPNVKFREVLTSNETKTTE